MFDPGRAFLAAVERESDTTAIADGKRRLSYAFWYEEIARVAGGLTALGLRHGDRWLSSCRTGSKMASLHWACQLAGIVVRPLKTGVSSPRSWTIASPMPTPPGSSSTMSRRIPSPARRRSSRCRGSQSATSTGPPAVSKTCKAARTGSRREPGSEDLSLLLYTSGTTGRPKGVPRRHRAERAAALAQIAKNLYARGERTLGVMPLYHTMGVRSLLAMALVDGTFVCMPRFDAAKDGSSACARAPPARRRDTRDEGCRTWARLAVPAAAVEAPAHAVTETATKTRMHKSGASEPRMEEARVTKAEASEVWTKKAAAEPAVPASIKSDGNSDRPSPAPWVTPIPARCIIRVRTRSNTLENNKDSLVSERGCLPIS